MAQTGVQILFAFLLTLAFTSRFAAVTQFQRNVYVLTLMLCAGATALLIAPAAFHRVVYRRVAQAAPRPGREPAGTVRPGPAPACHDRGLLLILDVVIGLGPALILAAATDRSAGRCHRPRSQAEPWSQDGARRDRP